MKCRWRKNDYPPANKQPGEQISTSVKSPQMLSCEEYLQTLSCKKTPCQHYKPPQSVMRKQKSNIFLNPNPEQTTILVISRQMLNSDEICTLLNKSSPLSDITSSAEQQKQKHPGKQTSTSKFK